MRRLVFAALLGLAAPAAADSLLPSAPLADTQLPDAAQEGRARALMEEIRCLVCQGQSVADSNADLAGDMRAMIRQRVSAGASNAAIRQWLIGRYGPWIAFRPPLAPATWPLWAAPVVLLVAGAWMAHSRFRPRVG